MKKPKYINITTENNTLYTNFNSVYIWSGDKVTTDGNNLLHSYNDYPALINSAGSAWWFKNGVKHRVTGPAFCENKLKGDKFWAVNGVICKNWKTFRELAQLPEEDILALMLKYGDI
jgi:hypothetical protein